MLTLPRSEKRCRGYGNLFLYLELYWSGEWDLENISKESKYNRYMHSKVSVHTFCNVVFISFMNVRTNRDLSDEWVVFKKLFAKLFFNFLSTFLDHLTLLSKRLTLMVRGAQCACTFFRKLFLHEKRGLEVRNFLTFPYSWKM